MKQYRRNRLNMQRIWSAGFKMMNSIMFGGRKNLEVFNSIVKSITINMMNLLHPMQWSSKMFFHDPTMFSDSSFSNSDYFISGFMIVPFPMCSCFSHVGIFARSAIASIANYFTFRAFMFHVVFHDTCNSIQNGRLFCQI